MEQLSLNMSEDRFYRTGTISDSPKRMRKTGRISWKKPSFATGSSSIDSKKPTSKFMMTMLAQRFLQASEDDPLSGVRMLKDQNVFSQFQNDLKVLSLIFNQLQPKQLKASQYLFIPPRQNQNLYKIVRGEIVLKRLKDGVTKIRGKGEFVQSLQEFKTNNQIEVQCKEDCTLVGIHFRKYQQILKVYLQHKKKLQALSRASLLSNLKRRQLSYIFQHSLQLIASHKQILFKEGEIFSDKCYFVIEGEILIAKKGSNNKQQVICYVTAGSFVGEEVLFDMEKRTYLASVHSDQAKLLVISSRVVEEAIQIFNLSRQNVLTPTYLNFLDLRQSHYCEKIAESLQIKESFHQMHKQAKMSPFKQKKITNILRDIENSSVQLNEKQRLLMKRYHMRKESHESGIISVDNPLFVHADFPGLRKFAKRGKIFESRAREGYKLPILF